MRQKHWKVYLAAVLTAVMLATPVTVSVTKGVLSWQEQTAQAQTVTGYYGSQLSGASLDIYQALAAHQSELMDISEIKVTFTEPILNKDYDGSIAQRAWDAFIYDHPEVFWIDISGTTNQGVGYGQYFYTTTLRLQDKQEGASSYNSYYRKHPDELRSDQAQMMAQARSVAAQAAQLGTRYEQVAFIHDWLAANNRYNDTAAADLSRYPLAHQAVSALVPDREGGPVCDGYSKAFQLICSLLDIPSVCISGTGISGGSAGSHMWNAVQMEDGKWYGVDVTWDDTDSKGGRGAADSFLLVGTETAVEGQVTFGEGHVPIGNFSKNGYEFSYPTLSKTAYEANRRDTSGTALDAATLAQVQKALEQSGSTMVSAPVEVSLLKRDTLMTAVRVDFGSVSTQPTAIVRVDGSSVRPVPASWSVKDDRLTAQVQLTEGGILVPVTVAARSFSDVPSGAWYFKVVNEAVQRLWMNGTGNGQFSPDGQLTGAQLRAILLRILGVPEETAVAGAPWYAGSEEAAANLGFVGGGVDPNVVQTRADAAIALTHTLTLLAKEQTLSQEEADTILAPYTDVASLDDDTRYALAMLVNNGLLQGVSDTELAPDAELTRAQMAALCSRLALLLR